MNCNDSFFQQFLNLPVLSIGYRAVLTSLIFLSLGGCGRVVVDRRTAALATNNTAQWLEGRYRSVNSPHLSSLLDRVTRRLTEGAIAAGLSRGKSGDSGDSGESREADLPVGGWQVTVLDSDHANAFSIGSGVIYLTRGLFNKLNSEAELAAVVGHEMAHYYLGHVETQLELQQAEHRRRRRVGVSKNSDLLTPHDSPAFSFSLEQELEADSASLRVMYASRYRLSAALSALSLAFSPSVPQNYYRANSDGVAAVSGVTAVSGTWIDTRAAYLRHNVRAFGRIDTTTVDSREFRRVKKELESSH